MIVQPQEQRETAVFYKRNLDSNIECCTIILTESTTPLIFHAQPDEPKVAYIEFEGEGVITAADIQADADIEIMNPDQIIATLSGGTDSKFYMELTLSLIHILLQRNPS